MVLKHPHCALKQKHTLGTYPKKYENTHCLNECVAKGNRLSTQHQLNGLLLSNHLLIPVKSANVSLLKVQHYQVRKGRECSLIPGQRHPDQAAEDKKTAMPLKIYSDNVTLGLLGIYT